jgi:hypothetical protein
MQTVWRQSACAALAACAVLAAHACAPTTLLLNQPRIYRAIMRRKLGLLGEAGAKAAAAAAAATTSAAADASSGTSNPFAALAVEAAAGGPGTSARPTWPLAAGAPPAVLAAAAAVAAAPLSAADEGDDALAMQLLAVMQDTGALACVRACVCVCVCVRGARRDAATQAWLCATQPCAPNPTLHGADRARPAARVGADFTNTFRRLALVPLPPPAAAASADGAAAAAAAGSAAAGAGDEQGDTSDDDFGGFLSAQLAELPSPAEMRAASKPAMALGQVQVRLAVRSQPAGAVLSGMPCRVPQPHARMQLRPPHLPPCPLLTPTHARTDADDGRRA